MGLGVRFDPGVIETPVGVLGDLLDELVGALTKSAKGGEGDRLEVDVQALLLDDVVRATILYKCTCARASHARALVAVLGAEIARGVQLGNGRSASYKSLQPALPQEEGLVCCCESLHQLTVLYSACLGSH